MKIIGISGPPKSSGYWRMLDALGEVLDVRFEERTFRDNEGIDAWIIHESDKETLRHLAHNKLPSYTVICDNQLVPCGDTTTIEFSRHSTLSPIIRGRRINTDEVPKLMALPRRLDNMIVLASKAGVPVWVMHEVEGQHHHYVALQIPELKDAELIFEYFYGRQFFQLLPLLLFLRNLNEDKRWEPPPLQACFMFDDPNLHWPTYGFIDFRKIIKHAQVHNYHVSFATIPLDTWFIHMATAVLFKQHSDRLSLLIHGNDHIVKELARTYSDKECEQILRQALWRIDKLERRSGVEVSRIMVAPHGACSEDTLRGMADLGFEAACISRGSLRHYNREAPWLRAIGMRPSDFIEGLAVLPRFPFSKNCYNSILVAALLYQPIIPMGHHNDIAEGLHILDDLSEFINSLGTVYWTDMKQISRSHYAKRVDGKVLQVRMFTKHIEVCIPEGMNQIWVERPWLRVAASAPLVWRFLSEGSEWKTCHPDEPIIGLSGKTIEIVSEPKSLLNDAVAFRKFGFWPVVRRQLTEARDRLAPFRRRISTLFIKPAIINK